MSLAIKRTENGYAPTLICDNCRKPIEDWRSAIVCWEDTQVGDYSDVCVYHKGQCDPERIPWQELSRYIPWLLWNHGFGIKHQEKSEEALNGVIQTITIEIPETINFES